MFSLSLFLQCVEMSIYILNQKRNFPKIGLGGGHTRYERKENRHLPQMKLKYQMKLMIFRLYMNFDFQSLCNNKYE